MDDLGSQLDELTRVATNGAVLNDAAGIRRRARGARSRRALALGGAAVVIAGGVALAARTGPAPARDIATLSTPTPSDIPSTPAVGAVEPSGFGPAAGTCLQDNGPNGEATMTLGIDVPRPRCLQVTADQHLVVVNDFDHAVQVSIGRLSAEIPAHGRHVFPERFGDYLAPGSHRLQSSVYSADLVVGDLS